MDRRKIEESLIDLVKEGTGYGDPDARLQDERKFQLLKHQQLAEQQRHATWISLGSLIVAAITLLLFMFQLFFKK